MRRLDLLIGDAPLYVCQALSRSVLGKPLPDAELQRLADLVGKDGLKPDILQQWLALTISAPQFQWR